MDICGFFLIGEYVVVFIDYYFCWFFVKIFKLVILIFFLNWFDVVFVEYGYFEEIKIDNVLYFIFV